MNELEEEQKVGDILAMEEEISNNELTGTYKIYQKFQTLLKFLLRTLYIIYKCLKIIERELNDIETTTFHFDEEELNQDPPVEEESNKGQKGIKVEIFIYSISSFHVPSFHIIR